MYFYFKIQYPTKNFLDYYNTSFLSLSNKTFAKLAGLQKPKQWICNCYLCTNLPALCKDYNHISQIAQKFENVIKTYKNCFVKIKNNQ